jgi:hypothetical protein
MIRSNQITHNVRNLFPKLKEYFAQRPEIEFGYVFGSYGIGKEKPLSDVDIAVFLRDDISHDRYFDFRLALIGDLAHILHTDEVDLVILNQASLLLAYQAVSSRTVLYERDPRVRIRFETRVLDKYFDAEPIRRVQQEYFKRHIQEGKIFG